MNSESRSMENRSEASGLEPETDMSQSGGGMQDSLLSPDSESMNPPESADLVKYLNQMIKSIDYLPSRLYHPSTTTSHSVTSMGRIAPFRVVG